MTEARPEEKRRHHRAEPATAPPMVVRTGTLVGPRPRSSAMRTPAVSVTGSPALAEVSLEEPRDLVDGLVGLVQCSEVKLEDVRALGGHLQRHLDVVPAGVRG